MILERDTLFGSIWISPSITGHFECITYSTPYKRDAKVALIRSCMDVANNPSHTLAVGIDTNHSLVLLNETAAGYIYKNDYPGTTGTVGYSVCLDLPLSTLWSYMPRFYVRVYLELFFHKREVPYFWPYLEHNNPVD